MEQVDWKKVRTVFVDSLKRPLENRRQFIEQSCADDKVLREEVESLLASFENADDFMETPAVVDLYGVAEEKAAVLEIGQKLTHYEILQKIGAGGMGEVYLARDTKLNRNVALKVYLSADRKSNQRLLREAQAAANLNHPNICPIHEISATEEFSFIVMQYVEGETLAAKIKSGNLDLKTSVNIAIQIADALDEAHSRNIIHHDIKPANIIINKKGQAIVLDFGLAKVIEVSDENDSLDGSNSSAAVIGTVSYMSPEQARGKVTDARTDIWSLGVVLYQMSAGKLPFTGETNHHIIVAILEKEFSLPENLTDELQKILRRALTKEKDIRYQTAKDLLIDLKNLTIDSDIQNESQRPIMPNREETTGKTGENAIQNSSENSIEETKGGGNVTQKIITTPKLEYALPQVKNYKFTIAAFAFFIVLAIVAGFGIYKYSSFGSRKNVELSLSDAKVTKLTTTGRASEVAISPDGKYAVYSRNDNQSLYLRQIATESNVEIVPPLDGLLLEPQFSPDGNFVYYSVRGAEFPKGALFQVPILGGEPKKILESVNQGDISFSPDGDRFAFTRQISDSDSQLLTVNTDGTNEEKLVESKAPVLLDNLAWSPDGKKIVFESFIADGGGSSELSEVQVADGSIRQLTDKKWSRIHALRWSANGARLFLLAAEKSEPFQLVQLSYPDGDAKKLTNDPDGLDAISLTADSNNLAVVRTSTNAGIWIAPADDIKSARPITNGSSKFDNSPSWLPDGRIIFSSQTEIKTELWSMTPDGGNLKQIMTDAKDLDSPMVSPDGKFIYFIQGRSIWRMNIDGSDARSITKENPARYHVPMSISSDGRWLFYTEKLNGFPFSMKISADGTGEAVKISEKPSYGGQVSPDGKQIAFSYIEKDNTSPLVIAPINGGNATKTFPSTDSTLDLRWSPDGRSLVYRTVSNDGVGNLLAQPINGGGAKKLTDFKTELIFSYNFSRDGKQIAFSRGNSTSDVFIYSNISR